MIPTTRYKIWFLIPALIGLTVLCQPLVLAICIRGDCNNGKGTFLFDDGGKYRGEWKNGKMHGKGKFTLNNQWIEGYWQNSKLVKVTRKKMKLKAKPFIPPQPEPYRCIAGNCTDGFGIYTFQFGQYEGYWQNGLRHGSGDFYWNEGDHYTGEWRLDRMHGYGFYAYKNGNRFSGKWESDKQHGEGILWKIDGTVLKGEWKMGEMLSTTVTISKPGSDAEVTTRDLLNYIFYSNQSISKSLYRLKQKRTEDIPQPEPLEPGEIPSSDIDPPGLDDIKSCAAAKEEVLRIREALEGRISLEKKSPTGFSLLTTDTTGDAESGSAYYHDKYYTEQDLQESLVKMEEICLDLVQ